MSKTRITWLIQQLPTMSREADLTAEQEKKLRTFYKTQLDSSASTVPIILSILGSLLIGLGVILIFAHNWGGLTPEMKSVISTIPLTLSLVYGGIGMFKGWDSVQFRETAALLIMLTFAAGVALVSQAYHTGGTLYQFLTLLLVVSIPLTYLLRSYGIAILFVLSVTWQPFTQNNFWWWSGINSSLYFLFLGAIVPFLIMQFRENRTNAPYIALNWLIAISLLFSPTFAMWEYFGGEELIILNYISLAVLFIAIDSLVFKNRQSGWGAPFRTVGKMLLLIAYILFSNAGMMHEIIRENFPVMQTVLFLIPPVIAVAVMAVKKQFEPIPFIAPALLFFISALFPVVEILYVVLFNFALITLGVLSMKLGVEDMILRRVNFGFIMIASVILLRFIDTDIPFTIRGVLFIILGIIFLITNIKLSKRRRVINAK